MATLVELVLTLRRIHGLFPSSPSPLSRYSVGKDSRSYLDDPPTRPAEARHGVWTASRQHRYSWFHLMKYSPPLILVGFFTMAIRPNTSPLWTSKRCLACKYVGGERFLFCFRALVEVLARQGQSDNCFFFTHPVPTDRRLAPRKDGPYCSAWS